MLPSAAMAYLSPLTMSFALHCHFTLASGFSVSASKTTDEPAAASRLFGFLVKAETTHGGRVGKSARCDFLMVAHRDYTNKVFC